MITSVNTSTHHTMILTWVVVTVLARVVLGEFLVGRVSEGQFEYPELNGWMSPRTAVENCENDTKCGGFTYKVCFDSFIDFLITFIITGE